MSHHRKLQKLGVPEVRVHLLEWRVTLHLYVGQHVQVWGNGVGLPSHPVVGETRIFYFILFYLFLERE